LSRNLYILAGTLALFAAISYTIAWTGLAHEPGAPSDAPLWRTIGIILLVIALAVALLGVLQHMFEQAERRTPGGQAAVHRDYKRRVAMEKAARARAKTERGGRLP
jgi:hypothetical protein